jgi:thymidylate synthase
VVSLYLNPQFIKARDLGDAWFQCLYKILEEGYRFKIDRGSNAGQERLEFDFVMVHIKHPGTQPLLPQIEAHHNIPNPVADDYLDEYLPYLMTSEIKKGESYTYGQRMTKVKIDPYWVDEFPSLKYQNILIQDDGAWDTIKTETEKLPGQVWNVDFLNQIDLLIWTYKNKGFRNNQMILQVGQPDDMLLQDPPCLRHIDTRIQDGKLHFYPYFRSWDLWGGFPANLAGIQLLKEYIASEIGVEDGEIIASSKGLHLYDYNFEHAKSLRMRNDIKLKEGE